MRAPTAAGLTPSRLASSRRPTPSSHSASIVRNSVGVHKAMGFEYVGTYREVGRKFGRYWDVQWFERAMP